MRHEYLETLIEMLGVSEDTELDLHGITDRAVVGLMLCKRLDRLADLLEKALAAGDATTYES